MEKELKTKGEWSRKTYPLKTIIQDSDRQKISDFLDEYVKVTNFVLNKCMYDILPFYKELTEEEHVEGKCPLCYNPKNQKEKKLKFKWKRPDGKIERNCGCLIGHYSLRKIFLPSSKRTLMQNGSLPGFDMRMAGELYDWEVELTPGGDNELKKHNLQLYDSCLQKAVETIKSHKAINEDIDKDIRYLRGRNEVIDAVISEDTSHIKNKKLLTMTQKYTARRLKTFKRKNSEKIEKLENRKAEKIEYKQKVARIYNTYYRWVERCENDHILSLKIFKDPIDVDFYGKEYQKKKTDIFSRVEKQPEIEIIEREGGQIWFQYVYKEQKKVKIPTESFASIGVNFGILNTLTYAVCDPETKESKGCMFFSGRPVRRRRRQMWKVRKIWQKKMRMKKNGGKGRTLRWFKSKVWQQKEKKYLKDYIHNTTTSCIYSLMKRDDRDIVIILPNFKKLRDSVNADKKKIYRELKGKGRTWYKKEKFLIHELNTSPFLQTYNFLAYKLNWIGVPVVEMPCAYKTRQCNKCGHVREEIEGKDLHELHFKCQNTECGYECNADFNNSINLSRDFYDYMSNSEYELVMCKDGIYRFRKVKKS